MKTKTVNALNIALVEALGISPKKCSAITIKLRAGENPTIIVEYLPNPDFTIPECLEHQLKLYKLEPIS